MAFARHARSLVAAAVLLAAVAVLSGDLVGAASDADPRAAAVRRLVDRFVVQGGPGLAVAVVEGGRLVHLSAHGLARGPAGGARETVTPSTRFDAASIAKQFTAASVLQLVEKGEVALDAPVGRYLPELASSEAKVRDLLWMTSGLADFHWTGRDFAPRPPAAVTNQEVVRFVARTPPLAEPGRRYEYSNADYVLLAALVERVTGLSYPEYLTRHVLGPAGMRATVQVDARHPAPADAAAGHEKKGEGWVELSSPLGVSGAFHLFSTAEDLARWTIALDRGLIVKDRALRDLAFTAGRLEQSGRRTRYGFGWNLKRHLGGRLAWHTGRWPGYRSYIGRYLDRGMTVVVLSNDHGMPCGVLGGRIAEIFAPVAAD